MKDCQTAAGNWPDGSRTAPTGADVVVIGARFAGLHAHRRFRALALVTLGFVAAVDVGGT